MTMTMTKLVCLSLLLTATAVGIHAFSSLPTSPLPASTKWRSSVGVSIHHLSESSIHSNDDDHDYVNPSLPSSSTRRNFFLATTTTVTTTVVTLIPLISSISPAFASGGATAGKYTTIPIAKRRYYGRVQQAVHEFLLMAPAVIKGDLTDPTVQVMSSDFFCKNVCRIAKY